MIRNFSLCRYPYIRALSFLILIVSTTVFLFFISRLSSRKLFFSTQYIDPLKDSTLFLNNITRANAAIIVLVKNGELDSLCETMRNFEERWNKKYNYPYVFLNDEEFTPEFKKLTKDATKAEVHYGLIPKYMWEYPPWINQTKAAEVRTKMADQNVLYGDSESYRHMCRFNSGFFFRHELVQKYDYYWRLEPGVEFMCDIDYDPFRFIQKNNITYGFTISPLEIQSTIPTLWSTVKKFINEHPQYVPDKNFLSFITRRLTGGYNGCHFWSNFEIGDLNFWRSEKYIRFFEYLDQIGGFYYERWGDAPIHSIALALFLEKSKVHFFNDIAYMHPPLQHCPIEEHFHKYGKCHCDPKNNFDMSWNSCIQDWFML